MNIIEVEAKDHYEAGYKLGQLTAKLQHRFLEAYPLTESWEELIEKSKSFLNTTKEVFPQYIDEIHGLANGARISFDKLWVMHCIDEILKRSYVEKCSSLFIKRNSDYLIGHNEDWDLWTKEYYFLYKKTINGTTILELGMPGVVCGGTVSINSHGLVQTINTLHHTDFQIGTPRQIIARWISGRESLSRVYAEFPRFKRAAGYCYNLYQNGKVLSIESSAKQFEYVEPAATYYHTNHYTGALRIVEEEDETELPGVGRYELIGEKIGSVSDIQSLKELLLLKTNGINSIYRITGVATVASLIIDITHKMLYVTQENQGEKTNWQEFRLDFLA